MRQRIRFALPAFFLVVPAFVQAQAKPAPSLPMCPASQLSLGTDDENGNFDGMSQSGTLLVLRNLGSTACRVDAVPQITFADASRDLPARGEIPGARFMHPGPVVLPVVLAPGAAVTSSLRWVSSEVYDKNVCFEPVKVTVKIGNGTQSSPLKAHLCGDATKGSVIYQMTRFAANPAYKQPSK